MQGKNRINRLLLGEPLIKKIGEMNVLLIGVGGIGCEVLKVVSKFEFKSLHILDLDTIEVSNLNRQFLFRKQHRGMYKSHVAKEKLLQDYPNVNIISYNDNIKDNKFGIKFFRQFQLVIMALDNAETRSFVNQICMSLNIPLLDAGTTGYKGQAFLLLREKTRCYDCLPRDNTQKVYPACTIRTLPEKPVHCVIWAKYLFGVLFGPSDDDSNLLEDFRDSIKQTLSEGQSLEHLALEIAEELFSKSIKKQMETGDENEEISQKFKFLKPFSKGDFENLQYNNHYLNNELNFLKSVHNIKDYIEIFRDTYIALSQQKQKDSIVQFEKDDPIIIKFVTAACNLRCHIFNIPLLNEFKVKQISGNIIPAIASTNAIVAAIEISETIKYLASQLLQKEIKHKELFVQNDNVNKVLMANLEKPNPNCFVCQVNILPDIVYCDFEQTTLGKVLNEVVLSEKQLQDYQVLKDSNLICEYNDYLEDDEQEQYQKIVNKKLTDIFGNGDSKITVTNEETEKIFRLYILVHIPNQNKIEVTKQKEGEREEVSLDKIMKEQGLNMKGDQEIEEEKQQLEKKFKKLGENALEILDSDEEIEMVSTNQLQQQSQSLQKRTIGEVEHNNEIRTNNPSEYKGSSPSKKIKSDKIEIESQNSLGKNNSNIGDDDEIIIL